jgi:capsular polysaccharide biosynthesis protein
MRSMIRLRWKLVIAIAAVVTAIAWIAAAAQPPRYRASAMAAIGPLPDELAPNEMLRGVEVLERRTVVATIAALASTPETRRAAGAASGYLIEATVLPNTNLFRIDVEGPNAALTAEIANRVPGVLAAQSRAMFRYYGVSMVSPASQPTAPYLPRTGRAIATGVLVGLFIGLLAAFVIARRAQTAPAT